MKGAVFVAACVSALVVNGRLFTSQTASPPEPSSQCLALLQVRKINWRASYRDSSKLISGPDKIESELLLPLETRKAIHVPEQSENEGHILHQESARGDACPKSGCSKYGDPLPISELSILLATLHEDGLHSTELVMGIVVGGILSAVAIFSCSGLCWTQGKRAAEAPSSYDGTLGGDLVTMPTVYYGGAFFRQISWSLDASALDRDGACRVLDADGRQLVRAVGRLMATPNGEVQLQNEEGITWAVLKRPVPSRRQGQLWDFKICDKEGAVFAEVKQRSETKAVVVGPPPSQQRLMSVIGNFGHRVFLTGERCVHVWTAHSGDRPGLGAQCEVRVEAVRCAEGGPEGQPVVSPVRSFYVSATMGCDGTLVLAALLGLQEVQTKLGCAARGDALASSMQAPG